MEKYLNTLQQKENLYLRFQQLRFQQFHLIEKCTCCELSLN